LIKTERIKLKIRRKELRKEKRTLKMEKRAKRRRLAERRRSGIKKGILRRSPINIPAVSRITVFKADCLFSIQ